MKIGKLTNEELKKHVLDKLTVRGAGVLEGPKVGADCSVLDLGGDVCILSSDPVTGAAHDIGTIAVNVACNDIAAAGAVPVGVMVTLLIPPQAHMSELDAIIDDVAKCAGVLGIDVLGGHTEVTDAVVRTVASVTAVGRMPRRAFDLREEAQEGDYLVMTKSAGLEGSAIIAAEKEKELANVLSCEELTQAKGYLSDISVVKDGRIGAENGAYLMHDVTEGGVLGAVWELCSIIGIGIEVDAAAINVTSVTRKLCHACGVDPLRLISSGSMLMLTRDGGKLTNALRHEGIQAEVIGRVCGSGARLSGKASVAEIAPPAQDELYRATR